jgi:hypothetical protein
LWRLAGARGDILAWWQNAWLDEASLGPRFLREAAAALTVKSDPSPDDIYTALEWRRLRLQQDQQVPEWTRLRRQMPIPANAAGASLL